MKHLTRSVSFITCHSVRCFRGDAYHTPMCMRVHVRSRARRACAFAARVIISVGCPHINHARCCLLASICSVGTAGAGWPNEVSLSLRTLHTGRRQQRPLCALVRSTSVGGACLQSVPVASVTGCNPSDWGPSVGGSRGSGLMLHPVMATSPFGYVLPWLLSLKDFSCPVIITSRYGCFQ